MGDLRCRAVVVKTVSSPSPAVVPVSCSLLPFLPPPLSSLLRLFFGALALPRASPAPCRLSRVPPPEPPPAPAPLILLALSHPASESVASPFPCAVAARGSGRASHTRPCARIKSAPSHRWLRIGCGRGCRCHPPFQATRTSVRPALLECPARYCVSEQDVVSNPINDFVNTSALSICLLGC